MLFQLLQFSVFLFNFIEVQSNLIPVVMLVLFSLLLNQIEYFTFSVVIFRNGQQTMKHEDKLKTLYFMDITVSAFS